METRRINKFFDQAFGDDTDDGQWTQFEIRYDVKIETVEFSQL